MKCKSTIAIAIEKSTTLEEKIQTLENCTVRDSKTKTAILSCLIGSIVSYVMMKHLTRAKKTQNTYFMSIVIFIGIFGSFFVSTFASYNIHTQMLKTANKNVLDQMLNEIEVYRKLDISEDEILKHLQTNFPHNSDNFLKVSMNTELIIVILLFVGYRIGFSSEAKVV